MYVPNFIHCFPQEQVPGRTTKRWDEECLVPLCKFYCINVVSLNIDQLLYTISAFDFSQPNVLEKRNN